MRYRGGAAIAIACFLTGWIPDAKAQALGGDGDKPIEISADTLEVFQDKQMAVFSGKVEAVQGRVTVKADKMTVYYTEEEKKGQQGRIQRLDVDGNVLLMTPEETAKGDKGVYYVEKKLVRLVGDVVLTRGKNVIKGTGLEYDTAAGKSTIVSSAEGGGRVKGLFIPGEQ